MHKVSYVLAIRFSKDLVETYFYKKHPPDAWKDDQPSMILVYPTLFETN